VEQGPWRRWASVVRATNLLPQGIVVPGCCQPLPWLRFWVRIGRRWTCPACLAIWEVQDCDGAKGWVRVADPVQGLLLLSGALLEMVLARRAAEVEQELNRVIRLPSGYEIRYRWVDEGGEEEK